MTSRRSPRETRAQVHACDASRRADVERLFAELDAQGAPDVVAYNASYRTRGPFVELDPDEVEKSLRVSALAGFYVAQAGGEADAAQPATARSSSPAPRRA